tara:strand:- start:3323 stop:3556 length:234 start_codon:yes stop_codon:yes gene_type:complete
MIIPVRCMTCGKIIGDKYQYYVSKTKELGDEDDINIINMNAKTLNKTKKGLVMDELGLKRYCCRRHFLTHVDLIDII